jgi:hypothetical protein
MGQREVFAKQPASSIYPANILELLAFISRFISAAAPEGLGSLSPALLAALRQQRLTPWLFREVVQRGWEGQLSSPVILPALRRDYALSLGQASLQQQRIQKIIGALCREGFPLILLKGADLRYRVYKDPVVRPMDDLDLLCALEDLPRIEEVLADLGYQRNLMYLDLTPGYWQLLGEAIHYESETAAFQLSIDVHWEIGALLYFYRIPYAPLRRDALPISFNGLPVYLLSAEHLLIHLCLNAFKESDFAVLKILDLMLVLSHLSLNWPKVIQEVKALGCQRPVYLILREICQLLPGLTPPAVLTELARYRPSWVERLMSHGWLRLLTLGLPSFYRHRSIRSWAFVILATLWPRRDYLKAVYGRPDRLAYFRSLWGKYL